MVFLDVFDIARDVKISVYGTTSFVIGQSRLNGPALIGDESPTWHPLECGVSNMSIEKGFSVNQGILANLEVGTARFELQGFAVDPTLNPLFQLNAQVEVKVQANPDTAPGFETIFIGFIDDIQTSYQADGLINVTVEATDWISKIMNVTIDVWERDVAETFDVRVQALFNDYILPVYPSLSVGTNWYPSYTGSVFPPEDRYSVTSGDLLTELIQGEAGMVVAANSGEVYGFGRYYWDNAIINPTYVPPISTNLIANSSLETGIQGWIGNSCNIEYSTEEAWQGTHSIKASYTGLNGGPYFGPSGSRIPVEAGKTYTSSMYVKSTTLTKQLRGTLLWYSAVEGGAKLAETAGQLTVVNSGDWTRLYVTGTAPAGATHAAFTVNANTTIPVGQNAYFDAALMEEGTILKTWYENTFDQGEPLDVPEWWGFSNVHNESLDHFCMGDVETQVGKSDTANEITVSLSYDEGTSVLVRNQSSINYLGALPFQVSLNLDAPAGTPDQYIQSWADDLSIPDGKTRVNSITWSPVRRDGRLNNSWTLQPGVNIAKVHLNFASHTIDDIYIVSKISHEISADNWVMNTELWKGI
tara:strand:- start:3949 stop:5703 length:1755 start_codon:yes stop_codon:yes gene_type:complete